MIYIGADHGGFELKEELKPFLKEMGYEVFDFGADVLDMEDDYPDFAFHVAEKVAEDRSAGTRSFGILLCKGGQGMVISANKVEKIRAVLCWNVDSARRARWDHNANVLSLPADILSIEHIQEIAKIFLESPFSKKDRHKRRLGRIEEFELSK